MCVYVRVSVCLCAWVYLCVLVCASAIVCMRVCTCVCTRAPLHTRVCFGAADGLSRGAAMVSTRSGATPFARVSRFRKDETRILTFRTSCARVCACVHTRAHARSRVYLYSECGERHGARQRKEHHVPAMVRESPASVGTKDSLAVLQKHAPSHMKNTGTDEGRG